MKSEQNTWFMKYGKTKMKKSKKVYDYFIYRNDPKVLDTQVWAKSVAPEKSSLQRRSD